MDRLLTLLLALTFAGALAGGGVYVWDRHAPVHYVLPWWMGHVHVGLPDSLAAQRDAAVRASGVALQARNACLGQLGRQNAALARLGQETAAKLSAARKAVSDARSVAESYRQDSARLDAYRPEGSDSCARLLDADRQVTGSLGP